MTFDLVRERERERGRERERDSADTGEIKIWAGLLNK